MKYLIYLFTLKGRLNRLTFIAYGLIAMIAYALVFFSSLSLPKSISIFIVSPALALWFAITISLVIRRVHDIGLNSWWGLIYLIPILNLSLLILPGEKQENKYGDIPKNNSNFIVAMASVYVFILIAFLIFGLFIFLPTDENSWAYRSYCNDSTHDELHKIFVGDKVGLKTCNNFSKIHFNEYKTHINDHGQSHSSGCKLIKAPFPWSLSLDK